MKNSIKILVFFVLTLAANNLSSQVSYNNTTRSGLYPSAIGDGTKAQYNYAFSSGKNSEANGNASTALGWYARAVSQHTTATGINTYASGSYATAMGDYTRAYANQSFSMGYYTIANSQACLALGKFNIGLSGTLLEIGNGTSTSNRQNALTVFNNGFVGIGITNPEAELHVIGRIINGGSDFVIGKHDPNYQGTHLSNRALVHGGWTNTDELVINYDGDFEGGIRIMGPHTIIEGNVTIGAFTNPANYKLAVDGTIMAEEIQVQLSENWDWPDYVFEKDYNLMSLDELENYIKTNHRLPNVPSENDIQLNGHNLGEMDAILLRKIEELTLYVLELKKENDLLKTSIQESK